MNCVTFQRICLPHMMNSSEEDGVILKRTGDYGTRAGVTAKPIATNSVLSVQVLLHALLHSFDHFMKTAVHVKVHVFDWTESPSSHNM